MTQSLQSGGNNMPFWQRSLVLVAAMMVVSFIFGLIWHSMFDFNLPGYASGVVAGLTAVPLWDLLKKVKPKQQ
jgi:hypothetical protein